MTAPAGWYTDPWEMAELRWWTGTEWTGWTHPPTLVPASPPPVAPAAATVEPPVTPAHSNLACLLGGANRFAVIDVETTGLYRVDRVVEVAIVTMDATGTVMDEFETLVNPHRDPGPTWIHGVTSSMLVDAPDFDDIAHHVAARLHGAVVVAHNLRFDTRMIGNEFERTGITVSWGAGLDTLQATGCKLGVACTEYGIAQQGAHRALFDARATGRLAFAVADAFTNGCLPVTASPLRAAAPRRVLSRDGFSDVAVDTPYLADLARGVHADAYVASYVTLLDRAVADLQLTIEERRELAALADELGLDAPQRDRAHREFLNGLIDAALEDSIVTDAELDQLCRVAALLDLDVRLVTRRTNHHRLTEETMELSPGLKICFTGTALDERGNPIDRSLLDAQAREHGLLPVDSLLKTCDLLVAADTASESSKIDQSRRWGIPVSTVSNYRAALLTGEGLIVTRLASTGIAQVCGQCGGSWMAARRASNPICSSCRDGAKAAAFSSTRGGRHARVAAAPTPPAIETLVCMVCLETWERPRTRGRRPNRCPRCANTRKVVSA